MPDRLFANVKGTLVNEIRSFDWASTELGPIEQWPVALKTAVALMLGSPFPMAVVTKKGMRLLYNDAFLPILGKKEKSLGSRFDKVWSEAWADLDPLVAKAFDGEATYIENFPLTISRGYAQIERAFFTFSYSPLRDEEGSIIGLVDTVIETTEAVKAKAHARMLSEELGHRLKNTLSLVQAIAAQTLAGVTPQTAVKAFDARVLALSTAHDLLVRESWVNARLRAIVDGAVALHANQDQYLISGPDLNLGPKGALSLAMLLHELSTNAVKYGAFSVPSGKVDISWKVEDADIVFQWIETGGPPVVAPAKTGIGSRLISSGLAGTGQAQLDYAQSGLKARFRSPLALLRDY